MNRMSRFSRETESIRMVHRSTFTDYCQYGVDVDVCVWIG